MLVVLVVRCAIDRGYTETLGPTEWVVDGGQCVMITIRNPSLARRIPTATITIGIGIVAFSPVDPNVRNLQGGMQ